jgi:hypothetical protein
MGWQEALEMLPSRPLDTNPPDRATRYLSRAELVPDAVKLLDEPPLTLDIDTWLYASDLHVPIHNREYIGRLMDVAARRKIKTLIIGGDLFDMGSLSDHPKEVREASYKVTKQITGDLLMLLGDCFERIVILPGNHDRRYWKRLQEPISFDDLIWAALAGRTPKAEIVVTNYDYLYIGEEGVKGWVVGHPRYFSTIPAKGGAEVAMIQHRNVCGAHNHVIGMMQSKCGRYWSVDPGHMSAAELTPYKMQSNGLSKYPAWRNGFLLVEGGRPRLMADGLVDWAEVA